MRLRGSVTVLLFALALALALPAAAQAHPQPAALAETALTPAGCPGDPIRVDRAIMGEFGADLQGSYVLLPFDMSAGTTAVRVKYCYDQPEAPRTRLRATRSTSGSTSPAGASAAGADPRTRT